MTNYKESLRLKRLGLTNTDIAAACTCGIYFAKVEILNLKKTANAMLESAIPVTVLDLIICFFVRTIIAIPLLAIVCHLLF